MILNRGKKTLRLKQSSLTKVDSKNKILPSFLRVSLGPTITLQSLQFVRVQIRISRTEERNGKNRKSACVLVQS